jgi:hypothetical protein
LTAARGPGSRAAAVVALAALVLAAASCSDPGALEPVEEPLIGDPPPTPAGISIENGPYVGALVINWPFVETAQTYTVYWSTTPGFTIETAERIAGVAPPYIHADREPGTTYYYAVAAVGAGGEGTPTTIVSGTPSRNTSLHVESPVVGGLVDGTVPVVVSIQNARTLVSLSASIAGVTVPLTYDASISRWTGTLSLASLPSPSPRQLAVEVADDEGDVARALMSVRYDRRPVLQVTEPVDQSVLTPSSRIVATCTDDAPGGCASLTAYVAGSQNAPLAAGRDSIQFVLAELLALFTSGELRIVIDAEDAAGQLRRATRTLIVP